MSVYKRADHTRTCRRDSPAITLLATVAAAFFLAGCDKPPPEAQLASAGKALGEATTELSDLDSRIEQTEALLFELRQDRRKQRDRVRTLEQRLEARATDVAVFRAVQTALLEDERLQDAAIAVDVEDGVVTLSGIVSTVEQAGHAVLISEETAGVESVSSRIQVNDPQAGEKGGS